MAVYKQFYDLYQGVHPYAAYAEAREAMTRYFWGMDNGVVLEIGALDGVEASESYLLHKFFDWKRILIEASPRFSKRLKDNSPDATSFGTAVCAEASEVHYIDVTGGTAGIIEFMNHRFLRKFHKYLVGVPRERWSSVQNVTAIQCLPMRTILAETRVRHINLFVLDVEGAELSVLDTIDFSAVRFDVICVETEPPGLRPEGFLAKVTQLLEKHGYVKIEAIARNNWFRHTSYQLSAMPS
eukprot:CAMPEP_0182427978 /NCGR_PEP_ID=MMETSP1167-20130531/20930_1 /TAXON_ID=2988 /ORGANISM="Mallomonas Sp, Strain CCMP3275" /LENGTH=239 /DNA_ID=CAMNT_0024610589 /DNA_START=188 /DNA_END=907 /DNA_ORIENTATION=-